MQKWEYLTVSVVDEKVVWVNGQKMKGPDFHLYLDQMGQDGWEVVGMSYSGGPRVYFVILKRPIGAVATR